MTFKLKIFPGIGALTVVAFSETGAGAAGASGAGVAGAAGVATGAAATGAETGIEGAEPAPRFSTSTV